MANRPELVDRVRDRLLRGVYALGWRHAGRLPAGVVRVLSAPAARLAVRRDGLHVRRLRHNLSVLTGRPADDRLVRAGVASYLRTFYEVLALPGWGASALDHVRAENAATLHDVFAERGAVVVLPHSGNWDLAGVWAGAHGMPVTTVAEQLGEAEYASFVAFRETLGMEVLAHRDPTVMNRLRAAVTERRLVCLIGDRDLGGAGVEVDWCGERVTLPAGPALLARRTGAALIPAVCLYDDEPLGPTSTMRLVIGPVVTTAPGRDGLVAMTQAVADFFTATLREHPQDWHLLQPFFGLTPEQAER